MSYEILKVAHISVMAAWLGLEIAMSILFAWQRRVDIDASGLRLIGRLQEFVSLGPKLFWMPMLVLGVLLTRIGQWGMAGTWAYWMIWLSVVIAVLWLIGQSYLFRLALDPVRKGSSPAQIRLARIIRWSDVGLRFLIIGALVAVGVTGLRGTGPITSTWLAWKLILFAVLISSSLGWKILGRTIGIARSRTVTADVTPDVFGLARLTRTAQGVLAAQWTLIIIITWLAVAKPG